MSRTLSLAVALVITALAIAAMSVPALAATPSSGTISTTAPTATWTGQTYVLASTTVPEECPPATDPANVLCDHFFLTLDIASNFWDQNTGQVTIRITWASSDNDFDLYVFGPDGSEVGSSAAGGTTVEEAALLAPPPGTYEVRVVPFLITNSGYSGQASLVFTPGGPAPNPVWPTGGIAFAPSVVVDPQRTEGEPIVHVDRSGNIWESGPWGTSTQQSFIHKSVDGGDSYHIVSPIQLRPDAPPGGGDTDVVTDDRGFAYFVDLEGLLNVGVAVSNDGGNIWRKNAFGVQSAINDRQWFAIDNGPTSSAADNTVFLTFRQVPLGVQVFSSPGSTGTGDPVGGLVYRNAADRTFAVPDATCGQPRFDPVARNLYLVCLRGDHLEVARGHVNPGQRTGIHFDRLALPTSPSGTVGDLFPALTVDTAGNLYGLWVDEKDHNVYLSASADHGATWTAPLHVNGAPANTNAWVWGTAGSPGIVDVVWYGTEVRGDPDAFPSWFNSRQAAAGIPWFVYFAQVRVDFANPGASSVLQVRASEHANHLGQICQEGLGCTTSNGDRTMADYFSVTIDATGAARIVYDDTTNQHHAAAVFEARQIAGPGAFGKKIRGTAPANPMADPAGDAQFPHFSPTGPGPNQAAMDFTKVSLSQPAADRLRVTMKVANAANLAPPLGAQSIIWLTRWQSAATGDGGEASFRIFYAGARSVAGGAPTFFSGTGTSANDDGVPGDGCVTNTPSNCKIVVYPAETAESGTFDPTKGTIAIDVPLADVGRPAVGAVLYSVTALSFGEVAGNPLVQDVDATRAFDFAIASGTTPAKHKVTGAGTIATDASGNTGDFDLVADTGNGGKVAYADHGSGLTFASAFISSVTVEGTKATIRGTGFSNGAFTTFVVVVQDLAEPGTGSDTFSISLGSGYARSGVLLEGNIQVH